MHIDILTLFPEMFTSYSSESILKRAQEAGHLTLRWHNIRDYATGKHRVTDEPPYGGGGGMILKPEPIFRAVEAVLQGSRGAGERRSRGAEGQGSGRSEENVLPLASRTSPIILMSPQGRPFSQKVAQELAQHERLILICGRYEGVDERVRQHLITDEISIGDYVLTGGELAAMVIVDAVARLLPGVLGAEDAAQTDSFATGLLEGPHYTRPETFRDWSVPEVLRSGHAANIARWRREQALLRTWQRRPELLETADLAEEDKQFLRTLAREEMERET